MKKSGIRTKVAMMTAIAMALLTATIAAVGYIKFDHNVLQSYVKYAEMVIRTTDTLFEKNDMGDLIANRQMGEIYDNIIREGMNDIKENADIKYLYSVYFEDIDDIHSICYAINGKNKQELSTGEPLEEIYSFMGEPCEEDAFAESTLYLFKDAILLNDDEIRYEESETTQYGRLVTCYKVVRDSDGNAVGIIGADIDVNQISRDLRNYLQIVAMVASVFTILMILLFIQLMGKYVTSPLLAVSESTDDFVKLMNKSVSPEELIYNTPKLKAKDEIAVISNGVESMAESIKNYMKNLESVTREKERIGAELNVATQIQADMLPRIFPAFPDRSEFDLHATMSPAKEVGGDFYDLFLIDDDHLGLVMADVSGKGVPAALFMVIAKTLIKNRAQLGGTPAEVLAFANEQLCEGNEAELFVTVWFAIVQISTGKGIAANAGHEHPAIRRKDGKWELNVYKHSPAVATMEGMRFREHEFEIHAGDSLFVYTDGVTEATNANNELFGEERLVAALNKEPDAVAKKLIENVRKDIDEFVADAPQFDDITMMAVNWKN